MELNYLDEKEVVAFCFNNLKETAFILYKDSLQGKKDKLNGLTLVEEDFHYKLTKATIFFFQQIMKNYVHLLEKMPILNKYIEKEKEKRNQAKEKVQKQIKREMEKEKDQFKSKKERINQ